MKGISGRKLRGYFLTLLVVIGLVLGMSLTVQAGPGENSCGDGVTWSYDSGTNILSINYSGSGTGVMTDYDNNTQGSAPPWYDHHTEIKTIRIDSGVTHIGNFAFENFLFLTEVTIPQGVVSIGVDAFCKCNSLTQVTIPSGVTSIGTAAFSACTTLKQITIPSSVTSIGNSAFAGCVLLNRVTFEQPTKEAGLSVGTSAFPVSEGNVSSPAIAYTGTGSLVLFDGDTQITTDNTAGDLNDKSLTWEVAGKRYPLWVGKTRVTENTMQGTGWSYNAADNILTLSGATITEGYSPDEFFAYGIYYFGSDELKIALTDKNTIGSMNAGLYGGINIVDNAALNIYGEGELTAYGTFFGIGGWKEIKIVGGTINAFGTGDDGIGISSDGDLTISGGTVNASGSNVTGIGISCNKSVIINGGVVTASGGYSGITAGKVKNAIAGTGWEDMAGTQGGTTIAVSTEGQQLGNNLKKVKFEPSHVHSFTYSVTGATITATCTANGCTLPPSTEGGSDHVATLTIGAPAMTTYGGTGSAEATITDDNGIQGDAKINYQEKTGESTYDTATETAPTDAGTYKAGITLGEGNGAATASVEYTIEKADPAATAPTATATYGQTLADVTLTNPEGNTPGTWAWVDSTQSVGNVVSPAATFKANFTPTSSNYKTVENVNVSVTVSKAAPTVTAPTAKTLTYTGTAQELVNAGSATGGTMYYAMATEKTPPTDENLYTTSIPTATDIGTYYVWYKAAGDENHTDSEPKMVKVTIAASEGNTTGTEEKSTENETGSVTEPAVPAVTIEEQETVILSTKKDADLKNSTFALLQAGETRAAKSAITVKWNRVKGATGYIVYGGKCKGAMKKLKTLSGTSFKQTKLKKGTYYKFIVVAHDGTNVVSVSKTIYAATSGGKVGNIKSLRLNKKKASIKAGRTVRLKASTTAESKSGKVKKYRAISYESSNPDVATVNKKGTVKGVGKGTCYVYVYAQNGVMAKAKITVK